MTIIERYPLGEYPTHPMELIGKNYNNRLIIYIELKIICEGILLDRPSYRANFHLYASDGKIFTKLLITTNKEQTAIDYCNQSKLPYYYE